MSTREEKVSVRAGRITVPAHFRHQLGLEDGSELIVRVVDDALVLEPAVTVPRARAWAHTTEHLDRLAQAEADVIAGHVRALDEDQMRALLFGEAPAAADVTPAHDQTGDLAVAGEERAGGRSSG